MSWARDPDRWRLQEREVQPDLIVAAIPRADALVSPAGLPRKSRLPAPILFVQQESDFCGEIHDHDRLIDRITSPFMSDELLDRADALVRVRQVIRTGSATTTAERPKGLGARVRSWFRAPTPRGVAGRAPYAEVAARVAEWADRRDAFQPGHPERVSTFCAMIAEGLAFGKQEADGLQRAAMLHDIGKVALPYEVLHEKGPLGAGQRKLIKTHPARGAALLRALSPDDRVARVVLYHHERPDGQGYYGKPAERVPRAAFALSVAEAFDAMTSSQLREPLTRREALGKLLEQKGQSYDSDCVHALVDSFRPRRPGAELKGAAPAGPGIPLSADPNRDGSSPFTR